MKIFMVLGGEKTKPIQSQTNPISVSPQTCSGGFERNLKKQNQSRPSAGNPKFEFRNPKRVEWKLFEKTKPKPAFGQKSEARNTKSETSRMEPIYWRLVFYDGDLFWFVPVGFSATICF